MSIMTLQHYRRRTMAWELAPPRLRPQEAEAVLCLPRAASTTTTRADSICRRDVSSNAQTNFFFSWCVVHYIFSFFARNGISIHSVVVVFFGMRIPAAATSYLHFFLFCCLVVFFFLFFSMITTVIAIDVNLRLGCTLSFKVRIAAE